MRPTRSREPPPGPDAAGGAPFRGEVLAPGVSSGFVLYHEGESVLRAREACVAEHEIESELALFEDAVTRVVSELRQTVRQLQVEALLGEAEIFGAHIALLEDAAFRDRVQGTVRELRLTAAGAVGRVLGELAAVFRGHGDDAWRDRAGDWEDLERRLHLALAPEPPSDLSERLAAAEAPVLALQEMAPAHVLLARTHGARGLLTARGTTLSHSAILARSLGIPMLRVARWSGLRSLEGQAVRIDAERGVLEIVTAERPMEVAAGRAPRCAGPELPSRARVARLPCALWLSVAHPSQLEKLDWTGAAGVGLYRTETLFFESRDFPTEEEQVTHYRSLIRLSGDRPVTIRTLDLGGDKAVPYLRVAPESNPFLGLRAHRLFRFHPEILITQLRAILRAAAGRGGLRVLFPMIGCLEEWHDLARWTRAAVDSLQADGVAFQDRFEAGVLVETPAAVLAFRDLIAEADFASVGTNDLVQFLFAVERGNADVASFYRPDHPIVLQTLAGLARTARGAGKPLSICGEIAGDPNLVPLLVGLGIEQLSVPIASFDEVYAKLAGVTAAECRELARRTLSGETTARAGAGSDRGLEPGPAPRSAVPDAGIDPTVDPVCGMTVDPEQSPFRTDEGGTARYFCSARCLAAFKRGQEAGLVRHAGGHAS